MGNYTISVLLAVHNGEKYIKKSILSVLSQTFQDFELLICANGCTDKTIEIIGQLLSEYQHLNNIKLFTLPQANKSEALNYLLKQATGNYIAIQDADDIWEINKLEEQAKYMFHFDIIGTQCTYIDHNNIEIKLNNPLPLIDSEIRHWIKLLHKNPIINCSVLINKKFLTGFSGYNNNYEGVEDFYLWAEIACNTMAKFININKPLVQHRLHADSHFNAKEYQKQKLDEIKNYINQINL